MDAIECSQPASKSSWDSQDFGDISMVLKMAHFRKSTGPRWVNVPRYNGTVLYTFGLIYPYGAFVFRLLLLIPTPPPPHPAPPQCDQFGICPFFCLHEYLANKYILTSVNQIVVDFKIWAKQICWCRSLLILLQALYYNDVIMSAMASQITSITIVQAQNKENTKAPRHWPLCGEFTGDRWIPRTNGQ